jgi:membrane-associated protease RseP (regulator of RpoE activity)
MNGSFKNSARIVFGVLVWTTFLGLCPAQPQDPKIPPSFQVQDLLLQGSVNYTEKGYLDQLLVFADPTDETFGATLQPVTEALRAQLDLPAGQGLLVASVRNGGPSDQVGLKQNDVLLALGNKSLASVDDLTKQLKAAGEEAVDLKLVRAGNKIRLTVRPVYRVTLGPVQETKTEYFLGVSLNAVDDALRAQLALPEGSGVLVTDIVKGTPAEKAGVKKLDIILTLAGKPIGKPDALAAQVQTVKDQPTTITLLRAGKELTIGITGEARKVEATTQNAIRFLTLVQQNKQGAQFSDASSLISPKQENNTEWVLRSLNHAIQSPPEDLRQQLIRLEKEIKDLHQALDKINETLKSGKPAKHE